MLSCKCAIASGTYGSCLSNINKHLSLGEPSNIREELWKLRLEALEALQWHHWYRYEKLALLQRTRPSYQPIC